MTANQAERQAMQRALLLARNAPLGLNPQVGAVLLSTTGHTLAEGWHKGAGTAHAEVDAMSKMPAGAVRGATAVVTLEPCNHTNRTGPCAEALIEAGVARVVYAIDDPGAQSSGGARRLREAGIEVESGVLAECAEEMLASWLTVQRLGRPHVTVKWAQSLDGRAAAHDGTSKWITGASARADVHRRRAEAGAIVVGTGTVLTDNPELTARDLTDAGTALLPHQPQPVIIGTRAMPASATVFQHPRRPWVYATHELSSVLAELRENGIHRAFVEGGPTLASAFIRDGFADEILTYIAPVLLGGDRIALTDLGVPSMDQARRLSLVSVDQLGEDLLLVSHPITHTQPEPRPFTAAAPEGEHSCSPDS